MRVWDIAPSKLCNRHLIAQHAEIHALWNVIKLGRKGFRHHPETRRWSTVPGALKRVHDETATEMERRGFTHRSPLPGAQKPQDARPEPITPCSEQVALLARKHAAGIPTEGVEVCGVG